MKIKMEASFIKFGDPLEGANSGLEQVVKMKAINIAAEAKSSAPKLTGRLANSIQYVTYSERSQSEYNLSVTPKRFEAFVGSALYYAIYQEFGTKYMPPQPYLRPAIALKGFNKDVQEIKAIMDREMASKLTKGKKIERFF